jgi:protein SCO1
MNPNDQDAARPRVPPALAIVPFAIALVALLVVFGPLRGAPTFHGTAWDPPQVAEDFELVDHTGRTTRLSQFRGRTVLLFFGFVNCPDVCPLTLNRLSIVLDDLSVDPDRVSVLLVTVDPDRDTPEALAEYVRGFGPHVVGLTGTAEQLESVRASFHAHASAGHSHDGHVMMTHTTQVFGIDRSGQIRVLISPEFELDTVRSDVRTLMRL